MNTIDSVLQNAASTPAAPSARNPAERKAFDAFVGETFYGQMLKAMRQSQDKTAYFNGGQAEQIFTQQLDQVIATKLAETQGSRLSGSLYELFAQARK